MVATGGLKGLFAARHRRALLRRRFPDATLEPYVLIKGPLENLVLEGRVVIQSGSVLHLGGMRWCEWVGHISLGEGSVVSPNCVLYGSGSGGIRIGRRFDCGPGVGIFASRTDYERGPGHHIFAPVAIGDDVTVFANAVISPGVTIGSRATIGACTVVTRDVPDDALVVGNPARVVRNHVRS